MAANPEDFRRYALRCVNQASNCTSPAASQKFADLALAWLMLAAQIEASAAAPTRRKAHRHTFGVPRFGSPDRRNYHAGRSKNGLPFHQTAFLTWPEWIKARSRVVRSDR